MKKDIPHLIAVTFMITSLLLPITACSNMSDGGAKNQTLSISLFYPWPPVLTAIERFKDAHPGVEVMVHSSYDADYEKFQKQVNTQLLAGNADDIVEYVGGVVDRKSFDSGLFADFYTLMQNDDAFNEDDYFMNVFASMAYNGKLYTFPTAFCYETVGVNNMFSEELAERFKQYDTITYRQLLDLYNSLPNKGNLYLHRRFAAFTAIQNELSTFVDFENKTCNFNNADFIKLITDSKNAAAPKEIEEGGWNNSGFIRSKQEEDALLYLFEAADSTSRSHSAFFPYSNGKIFDHYIPVASGNGNLVPVASDYTFCISETSDNKELAWEFIKFITLPETSQDLRIFGFPVNKKLYKAYMSNGLAESVKNRQMIEAIDGETEEIAKEVMALFEKYIEMPMESPILDTALNEIIYEVMTNFQDGVLTAEQAASELQNKISLYLME